MLYHATRHSAPQTRLMGAVGAVAIMGIIGVGLVYMRREIPVMLPPPPMVMTLPEDPVIIEPEPLKLKAPEEDIVLETPPLLEIPPPPVDIAPPPEAPPAAVAEEPAATPPVAIPAPPAAAAGPPATRPKLRGGAKPEYPGSAIRAQAQGTTSLKLCVSARGQVSNAQVVRSSGSTDLDKAALSWIQRERFTPGTQNGAAVDMCDHQLDYVWELPKR